MSERFLSLTEVAHRLGVTTGGLLNLRLPEPDALIGRTRGWKSETIDQWNAARPRHGGRPMNVYLIYNIEADSTRVNSLQLSSIFHIIKVQRNPKQLGDSFGGADLLDFKKRLFDAMYQGTKRNVVTGEISRKANRVSAAVVLIGADTTKPLYVQEEIRTAWGERIPLCGIDISKLPDYNGEVEEAQIDPFSFLQNPKAKNIPIYHPKGHNPRELLIDIEKNIKKEAKKGYNQ